MENLSDLHQHTDPITRARVAAKLITWHREVATSHYAAVRADAIRAAIATGRTQAGIATELGITGAAVSHALRDHPAQNTPPAA